MRRQILQQSLFIFFLFFFILPVQFCTSTPIKPPLDKPREDANLIRKQPFLTAVKKTKQLAKKLDYNQQLAFLVDMQRTSGSKRFFVVGLTHDSIILSGLVTHGTGSSSQNSEHLSFSNTIHSNASSLGFYKIGARYFGKFGLAYKLHGLSATNSNAFARAVVLHAHPCVPENEIHPNKICESWGCPTVAPSFLTQLDRIIRRSTRPILLQIYY